MESKINKVLELANGSKYYVINQAIYKGNNYYFVVRVTDDKEDIVDEFRLLEEKKIDGQTLLSTVEDPEMIQLLGQYLEPKEE